MNREALINEGLPFLESIPDEWQLIPNKWLFKYDGEKVGDKWKDYSLLSLTTQGIKLKDLSIAGGKVPESYENYQTVRVGQMVFCLFDLDVSAVFSGISELDGMITSAYDVFSSTDLIRNDYANYWFKYVFSNRYYKFYSKNIRFTVTNDNFGMIKTPLPPVDIQRKIAKILKSKESKITALVANEEKQIEKLKAYKQVLISEVVTKGLNPNAPMKDSGIQWVGKIPANWNIGLLKSFFEEKKTKNKNLSERNLLSLSYGEIVRKDINSNEGLLPESFEGYNIVEPGFIILRLTDLQNDKRSLRTGLVNERGIITSAYLSLCPRLNANSYYFQKLLHSYDIKKVFYNMGSGVRQSLSYKEISKIPVLIPPILEQNQICSFIKNELSKLDKLITGKNLLIDQLNSYYQSLIYEYVTGRKEAK